MFPVIAVPTSTPAAKDHQECPVSSCSHSGPVIQYPFRRRQDPLHCGNSDYEVFCSTFNKTMMKLSTSSGFFTIESINYKLEEFSVSDPDGCLPKRLLNLTISNSFHYPLLDHPPPCGIVHSYYNEHYHSNPYYFTVLKCSTTQNFSLSFHPFSDVTTTIRCLSMPGHHQVLVIPSYSTIDNLPDISNCSTLIPHLHLPFQRVSDYECEPRNVLILQWRSDFPDVPECQNCTGKHNHCQLNNTRNQMECYHHPNKLGTCIIAVGVAIGCCLLISIVVASIFYYMRRSNRKEKKEKHINIEKFLHDHKSHVPTRYSYADIKKMTNGFKSKLGEGGFGSVYQGKLPSSEVMVAVKVFKDSKENGDDFVNEVGTIGRIHHVNVVRLLGFSAEAGKRALIYEHMPNGSLEKFITANDHSSDNTASFDWEKLHNIIIGIAKGIEYLHQGCDQRILHLDIKPHNILLDHGFNPKISDFGLAKLYSKEESMMSMTAARGTIGYIAPEVYNGNFGTVSSKSDVYSFGMLVLEVIGARKETTQTPSSNGEYFPELIYKCLSQGEELDLELGDDGEAQIAKILAIVALWCIQWYPVNRSSMKAVVRMLEGDSATLIMPPNPFASTSMHTNPATTTL